MKDTRDLPEWTVWSKPLITGAQTQEVAALVINTRQDKPMAATVALSALGVNVSATGVDTAPSVKQTEVWSGQVSMLNDTEWHVTLPAGGHRWVVFEVRL
jgi:hypothetical protein